MQLNELTAISPIDGRYRKSTVELSKYFSEAGLIRYRVFIEIKYFKALVKVLPQLKDLNTVANLKKIERISEGFSISDAEEIKEIEKITNHDVKAVEYFIKKKFDKLKFSKYSEFVHFGLTSQDINNSAIPLSLKESNEMIMFKELDILIKQLKSLAKSWEGIPMLARTHGQAASPTRLGKEMVVFIERLNVQLKQLKHIPVSAKFGGATGNLNAHYIAYPNMNWHEFAGDFIRDLGMSRSYPTTQIEHYDNLSAMFDAYKRINTILIDFCRDIWTYISIEYFKQKIKEGEVGSSAMPHKVNPIDFENAEGNLMLANSQFEFLSMKLPISRLQRDLTDSTVLRNIGVPLAHTLIAYRSIMKGLGKLIVNTSRIQADLEDNWAVIAEAIQTILRREQIEKPYELLKNFTRNNQKMTREIFRSFIVELPVSDQVKKELMNISPFNFVGK
ncbi:MAG: adenylosuccinate lyase [Flavobacteriales bacterium]|nr:adenylosuccinate lyase [Flavobacteriales bacterium]